MHSSANSMIDLKQLFPSRLFTEHGPQRSIIILDRIGSSIPEIGPVATSYANANKGMGRIMNPTRSFHLEIGEKEWILQI